MADSVEKLVWTKTDPSVVFMHDIIKQIQKEKRELLDRVMSRNFADFAMARQALEDAESPASELYRKTEEEFGDEAAGEVINASG